MTTSNRNDWSEGPPLAGGHAATSARHQSDLSFVTSSRSADEFARAHRHSLLVARLKFGLPIAAAVAVIAIVGVFAISSFGFPSINLGFTRVEDGKLVMDNPHLNGLDSNQRPYKLTARRAIQDSDRPTRIALEEIEARLPLGGEGFAVVTAGSGVYDADGKTLSLGDSVALDTEDGMSVRLQDADIDIATGTLSTKKPATVDTGRAVVSADTLSVEEKGKRIVFETRVRMTIRPGEKAAGATASEELRPGKVVALPVADARADAGAGKVSQ